MKNPVEFRVKAIRSATFPMDMLRYDQCFPRNSDDAQTIAETLDSRSGLDGLGGGPNGKGVEIELVRDTDSKKVHRVTTDRWLSFGWQVISIRIDGRELLK